jgi:hypothetical protein
MISVMTLSHNLLYFIYDRETTTIRQLVSVIYDNYKVDEMPKGKTIGLIIAGTGSLLEWKPYFELAKDYIDQNVKLYAHEVDSSDIGESGKPRPVEDRYKKLTSSQIDRYSCIRQYNKPYKSKYLSDEIHKVAFDENNQNSVTVVLYGSNGFTVGFVPTMTVEDLKEVIAEKSGIRSDQQRILFAGKQLEDGRTFEDYNIRNGAKIYLVQRLFGGMYNETSGRAGDFGELKDVLFYVNVDPIDLSKN